jgi:cytochrome c oxidase assembly protein subunit 15
VATLSAHTGVLRVAEAAHPRFQTFAWGVLGWNVLVVLWGAYVRASGSGAGCGSHWPLCNGEVLPHAPRLETIIEFSHRLSSGAAAIAVAALCIWAFRSFPKRHLVRQAAALSLVFILLEALLGAGLVLFEYVDQNKSVGRAFYLSAHLVNTLLLLAALTLTALFAGRPAVRNLEIARIPWLLLAAPVMALLVSVTGVIAALGDTLFPAASLAAGLRQDISATTHFLVRLRVIHPALAVATGVFLAYVAMRSLRSAPSSLARSGAGAVAILAMVQLCGGAINIALLAPVWMQLIHLLVADLLWIALVVLLAESASRPLESNVLGNP